MQFLYPIGLLALAGLIIPLLIHLWNVKKGKTLKIGSISLLGESAHASSKSFRINDWLLLALRFLLLILLAFLLAQPILTKTISANRRTKWILVDVNKLAQVYKEHQITIDSLLENDYSIHDFNIDFKTILLGDTSNFNALRSTPSHKNKNNINSKSISYTSLLNQLNEIIPSASVYLFADHRLRNFENELPKVNYQLHWKLLQQSDTLSTWTSVYAGKQYEAKSSPSGTIYKSLNVDADPIKVAIYEPSGTDSKYLIAALNAIANFSKRKIVINPTFGKIDLGFWLSDEPVSASFKATINQNGSLFKYEKGKINATSSYINVDGNQIRLYKRIAPDLSQGKLWTDGFGHPVLSSERTNNLHILHFYSRFNPQWNELVWNEAFVKALMPLVIRQPKAEEFGFEDQLADQRVLSIKQKEIILSNTLDKIPQSEINKSIMLFFWMAALLIFIIERILSFRKTRFDVKN